MKKQKQNNKSKQNKTLNILCFSKPRDKDDRKRRKRTEQETLQPHFLYL